MKVLLIILIVIAAIALVMAFLALIKKPSSVYKNKPEEKNPMEGKKVKFIENSSEKENADGVRGHLMAIGDTDHKAGIYEKVFKRLGDIILSFGGLVLFILAKVFSLCNIGD